MEKKANQIAKVMETVKAWLSEEGYKCKVDDDGDFFFKYQGKNILFIRDEDDPFYYRFVMPAIYDIEEEDKRENILEICNKLSGEKKCLKAYVINDSVWISIEMFVDPENCYITTYLQRCLDIIIEAYFRIANLILGKD